MVTGVVPIHNTCPSLSTKHPSPAELAEVPTMAKQIITPLNVEHWRKAMSRYPDVHFAEYIVKGITRRLSYWISVWLSTVQLSEGRCTISLPTQRPHKGLLGHGM